LPYSFTWKSQLHRIPQRISLVLAALGAAVAGWLLTWLLVADDSVEALVALALWLAAGVAAAWFGADLWERTRAAEARLARVEEAASDAILRINGDGEITAWSDSAEALYGYASGEVVGRHISGLLDDSDDAEAILDSLRDGERIVGELVAHRRRDGTAFTASLAVLPEGRRSAVLVARDVGELRRTKDELGEVRSKYRSLAEHLPLVTYVRSADGEREPTFVSPQLDRLVGYTPEQWLADPGLFLRLVHPEDRDRVAEVHQAIDAAHPLRTNYRMVARDGRTVWVREEAAAVLDESGAPFCIQGFLLDVSEREAAEEARKELRAAEAATAAEARDRERKIELVAEAAAVLDSSLDLRSTVRQVAALAVRELADWCVVDLLEDDGGVTRYAAERAEPAAMAPDPEPPEVEVIRELRPELSESQIRVPLVARGRRALGALTLVAGDHAPRFRSEDLAWARGLAGMIALAIEGARLHGEVEARSDANRVLTHVGEGVFLLDRGGVVRLWNPASAGITGVTAEAAVGKSVAEVIPDWLEVAERVPVGTTREPVRPEAVPLDTSRGERWISIAGADFFGGTVYAFRDITEEHRLDELKAEFIATASHELRTPLAAVYGAAQTLRRHDFALDDAGRERFISLIVDESNRLAGIVNQILLANQLEMGRLDLVTEPFDAADLVERVVESARTHAPDHVTFEVHTPDDVPPVAADKDQARQVLVNLVENAVKYSPGGGRIELGLEAVDGEVRFRVVDQGMGIPEDEQRRIFEKFYRLDPNMIQGIGGTGLGLYICRELVERMGGRIWLESEEGKGSAFFFQLPSAAATPALPEDVRAHGRAPGHGRTRRR
jgi:PAS domain S-box-containing protein